MIKVYKFVTGFLSANTYILVKEGETDAVAIDIGGDENVLVEAEKKGGFTIKAVLLTHGHFDHIGGTKFFQDRGAKVYINKLDNAFLSDAKLNLSTTCGINLAPFTADNFVVGGDEFTVCGITFKVISTPGHTKGSVCYITGDMMFSGDTIFDRSFGRYDFPTGNANELINSINDLFSLTVNYKIYAGHGDETTLFEEKLYNPINDYT